MGAACRCIARLLGVVLLAAWLPVAASPVNPHLLLHQLEDAGDPLPPHPHDGTHIERAGHDAAPPCAHCLPSHHASLAASADSPLPTSLPAEAGTPLARGPAVAPAPPGEGAPRAPPISAPSH